MSRAGLRSAGLGSAGLGSAGPLPLQLESRPGMCGGVVHGGTQAVLGPCSWGTLTCRAAGVGVRGQPSPDGCCVYSLGVTRPPRSCQVQGHGPHTCAGVPLWVPPAGWPAQPLPVPLEEAVLAWLPALSSTRTPRLASPWRFPKGREDSGEPRPV